MSVASPRSYSPSSPSLASPRAPLSPFPDYPSPRAPPCSTASLDSMSSPRRRTTEVESPRSPRSATPSPKNTQTKEPLSPTGNGVVNRSYRKALTDRTDMESKGANYDTDTIRSTASYVSKSKATGSISSASAQKGPFIYTKMKKETPRSALMQNLGLATPRGGPSRASKKNNQALMELFGLQGVGGEPSTNTKKMEHKLSSLPSSPRAVDYGELGSDDLPFAKPYRLHRAASEKTMRELTHQERAAGVGAEDDEDIEVFVLTNGALSPRRTASVYRINQGFQQVDGLRNNPGAMERLRRRQQVSLFHEPGRSQSDVISTSEEESSSS